MPGSGIGQVGQVVKDGLCDGTKVIMRVTPLHLIDHADRLSIRRGSRVELCYDSRSGYRGADACDQCEPQSGGLLMPRFAFLALKYGCRL